MKKRFAFIGGLLLALSSFSIGYAETMQFEHVMNIGTKGSDPGQFLYVEDFALDAKGNLLATDALNSNIQAFDRNTGAYISGFGGKNLGMEKPEGIAVDKDGNIYTADYQNGEIRKWSKDYKPVKTFSKLGSGPGENMKSEFMDLANGLIYLPEQGSNRVDVFDLNGTFKFMFGEGGEQGSSDPGKIKKPEAAKVSPKDGNVYVVDLGNHRIQIFDKDGKFIRTFGKKGTGPGEFARPAGLSFDKEGNIYITEIDNDRVQVFDPAGNSIAMFGKGGSGNGEFKNVHGILVDDRGYLFIADSGNNRIQVFKPAKK